MEIKFKPNNFKISEKDIKDFENKIGYSLPQDYREFILKNNGGKFEFDEEKGFPGIENDLFEADDGFYWIDIIYPIKDNNPDYCWLYWNYENAINDHLLPKEILPIMRDPGGLKLHICLDGEEKGGIFVYTGSNEDEKITIKNFKKITKNFKEFFDNIKFINFD